MDYLVIVSWSNTWRDLIQMENVGASDRVSLCKAYIHIALVDLLPVPAIKRYPGVITSLWRYHNLEDDKKVILIIKMSKLYFKNCTAEWQYKQQAVNTNGAVIDIRVKIQCYPEKV